MITIDSGYLGPCAPVVSETLALTEKEIGFKSNMKIAQFAQVDFPFSDVLENWFVIVVDEKYRDDFSAIEKGFVRLLDKEDDQKRDGRNAVLKITYEDGEHWERRLVIDDTVKAFLTDHLWDYLPNRMSDGMEDFVNRKEPEDD